MSERPVPLHRPAAREVPHCRRFGRSTASWKRSSSRLGAAEERGEIQNRQEIGHQSSRRVRFSPRLSNPNHRRLTEASRTPRLPACVHLPTPNRPYSPPHPAPKKAYDTPPFRRRPPRTRRLQRARFPDRLKRRPRAHSQHRQEPRGARDFRKQGRRASRPPPATHSPLRLDRPAGAAQRQTQLGAHPEASRDPGSRLLPARQARPRVPNHCTGAGPRP